MNADPTMIARPATAPEVTAIDRASIPRETVALARYLLGKVLVRESKGVRRSGRIVETEAYLVGDPACHAFRGISRRNRSLFLDAGHAYVYLCYGTSYLLNVSSEAPGVGAGVLLRALEPMSGIEAMRKSRGFDAACGGRIRDLARGPGRLTVALGVDLRCDGIDLFGSKALWIGDDGAPAGTIAVSRRIGITKGAEAPLRFFVAGNESLSGTRILNAPA